MITVICNQCKKEFQKHASQQRSKKNHAFCSRSCAVIYNNLHKAPGVGKRSFFEKYLEELLRLQYPGLDIRYSDNKTIGSELDIIVLELNVAFEINGIYHYEPVCGQEILERTKLNDAKKRQACKEKGIDLVEIDISNIKHIKRNPEFVEKINEVMSEIQKRLELRK